MRRIGKAAIVLAFISALCLTAYPYILNLWFNAQANSSVEQFQNRVIHTTILPASKDETEAAQPEPEPEMEYADLYQVLSDYNNMIYSVKEEQTLTDIMAYEDPAVDVSKYLGVDSIGYINIPAMDVELPLYMGATEKNMSRGAVVLGSTSCPIGGINTNCAIAAHRGYRGIPYFREIEKLQVGDSVFITNPWETLEYTVTGWEIVHPNSPDKMLVQDGKDMLTLITCHPYRVGTNRYLVYCERKEQPNPTETPAEETQAEEQPIVKFYAPVEDPSEPDIETEVFAQKIGLIAVLISGVIMIGCFIAERKHR